MSLLLDALKKAAKEKEEADNESLGENTDVSEPSPVDPVDDVPPNDDLTLDLDAGDEELPSNDSEQPGTQDSIDEEQELILEQPEVRRTTSTVSDEALQMLVYKTNREHRRRQKTVWLGVTLTAVLILMIGGYYFYSEMVKDVEALERKHRIALQKVNAEVIKRKDPELIADLTSAAPRAVTDTEVSQPVQQVVQTQVPAAVASYANDGASNQATSPGDTRSAVNISSRVKKDTVGEQLEAGWLAYNAGDLTLSQQNYERVLEREPDNRDALLGVAAIAVANADDATAMRYYEQLLRLDPQDPVAAPALASLRGKEFDGLGETSLKNLLKRNPQAHQASFALGNIKAAENNWPQAQAYYFDAWSIAPDNADYAFNIAVSLDNLGKQDEAIDFYQRSLSLAGKGNHSFPMDAVRARLQQLER